MFKRILNNKIVLISIIVALSTAIIFSVRRIVERGVLYPLSDYKRIVVAAAIEYDIDVYMLFGIIKTESGFNSNAISERGATGLMQLTEKTAAYVAELKGVKNYDLKDSRTNVDFGCYYLKYLFGKFAVRDTVLAAYNAGEGKVSTWLKDVRYSDDGKTIKTIPIVETREYVKRINDSSAKYKKLYPNILDKR